MNCVLALHQRPKILLADDHPAMLKAVADMVRPQFDVVGAVGDGKAALEAAARTNPDVVVTDISMPEMDGIRLVRQLKQQESPSKVVFLTSRDDDDYISEAMILGVHGYVIKQRMHLELLPALDLALAQQYFISPYRFAGSPSPARQRHLLEFYSDETIFFQRVAEAVYIGLANGERVFLFLSLAGLNYVGKALIARGVNLSRAMEQKKCIFLCVERVIPLLTLRGWSDSEAFETFFGHSLEFSAACAREEGARVIVFSDLTATLLKQGHGQTVAAHIEEIWNNLVSRHSCTVYCECSLAHLGCKEDRKTLSHICGEHSKVIPIKKFSSRRTCFDARLDSSPSIRRPDSVKTVLFFVSSIHWSAFAKPPLSPSFHSHSL